MTPRHLLVAAVVLGAAAACAFAVVRRDDTPDSLYRKLGNKAAFASVGRVDIDY